MKEIKTHRDLMRVLSEGYIVESKPINGEKWQTVILFEFDIRMLDDLLYYEYRIKPSKPSINWSQVSEKYQYLARDANGDVYLYVSKPELKQYNWLISDVDAFDSASAFKSLDVGNCVWYESLVERPKIKE